ncbi:MAG: type II toxin-antitoxin system VapC family toxin [Terriglobales bacterium]
MKTYVFDAGALLCFLQGKPSAAKVGELLKQAVEGRAEILMAAVNFGEVYGVILRERGPDAAVTALSALRPLPIRLVDATPERCLRAAEVKTKYRLCYVDSFAAQLALENKATLVASDSDFRKLGHGVAVVWLKG